MLPVGAGSLANDEGAGERGEGHGNRTDGYPDAGLRRE